VALPTAGANKTKQKKRGGIIKETQHHQRLIITNNNFSQLALPTAGVNKTKKIKNKIKKKHNKERNYGCRLAPPLPEIC
jgi:hypothetical protein